MNSTTEPAPLGNCRRTAALFLPGVRMPGVDHSLAYTGRVPGTGALRCQLCGTSADEIDAAERAACCSLSYVQASQRLDAAAWRWFKFFWLWSAPRFSGTAGARQDRAFKRLRAAGYRRRIARVAALIERLQASRAARLMAARS